ncbi:hypothetical protein C0Q70_17589 [Pomacea canaliculata]|uniref:Uncharacterized protein n=1 Tax=Pomacea canaliculata TaxID=400727 RepID=A0A2T7NKT9_POMCA|nr:hypothetical protein C0Q70_17589 [Pomacea canaliculata]
MKDDLYEGLIARFCGPATTSAVDIPRTPDSLPLPKTLDQTVSVIGDFFDRCTLCPGMTELLQERRVFLSGPPGTGKTRLLGLVGRKWLSEGHVVQIVNTSTELTSATLQLVKILQEAQSSDISPNEMVVSLYCNTKRRKDIRDLITNLKATAGEKYVCVLVDDRELCLNREKSQRIQEFFESLLEDLPDINCWASSCSTDNAPEGWRSEVLTIPISCPPAVLREAMKEKRIPGVPPYSEIKFTPPTEGMPELICMFTFANDRQEDAIEDRENTLAVVVSIVLDKKVTVEFQEFLLKKVREIFPDMRNTCYFVPSIYFNKTRYKTETVAGQVVYIPDPPDPGDVQYNQVMQKVLLCLRNIVKTKHERMFVLTNFNYDDYLNNPDHSFIKHGLPVPAGLKKQKGDNEISCVDFLIIHRRYGVVVGVVKTVSDKDDGSEDRKKKIDHLMVTEVSEAILQLTKAVRMIKHLISDQNHPLKVRQTIVLPSAASSTLNRVLHNHPDLAQHDKYILG